MPSTFYTRRRERSTPLSSASPDPPPASGEQEEDPLARPHSCFELCRAAHGDAKEQTRTQAQTQDAEGFLLAPSVVSWEMMGDCGWAIRGAHRLAEKLCLWCFVVAGAGCADARSRSCMSAHITDAVSVVFFRSRFAPCRSWWRERAGRSASLFVRSSADTTREADLC